MKFLATALLASTVLAAPVEKRAVTDAGMPPHHSLGLNEADSPIKISFSMP